MNWLSSPSATTLGTSCIIRVCYSRDDGDNCSHACGLQLCRTKGCAMNYSN